MDKSVFKQRAAVTRGSESFKQLAYCDPLLINACANGAVAEVARLLDRTNPGCRDGETGDYPLTAAIRHGQWNVVILLLECDKRVISSINSRSKDLHTPLLLLLLRNASAFDIPAVSPGRRPAGKAMFATQSTASTSPTFPESSEGERTAEEKENDTKAIKCVELLLAHGANVNDASQDAMRPGLLPVEIALETGQSEIAILLLSAGCMSTATSQTTIREEHTLEQEQLHRKRSEMLFHAASVDDTKAIECLSHMLGPCMKLDINVTVNGVSPLLHALRLQKIAMARYLLEHGATANTPIDHGHGMHTHTHTHTAQVLSHSNQTVSLDAHANSHSHSRAFNRHHSHSQQRSSSMATSDSNSESEGQGHLIWQAASKISDVAAREDMMLLLVQCHIDLNASFRLAPLQPCSIWQQYQQQTPEHLLRHPHKHRRHQLVLSTPLIFAIEHAHDRLIASLLQARADVAARPAIPPNSRPTLGVLHTSSASHHHGGGSQEGDVPLAAAIRNGRWKLAQELLTSQSRTLSVQQRANTPGRYGLPPLISCLLYSSLARPSAHTCHIGASHGISKLSVQADGRVGRDGSEVHADVDVCLQRLLSHGADAASASVMLPRVLQTPTTQRRRQQRGRWRREQDSDAFVASCGAVRLCTDTTK